MLEFFRKYQRYFFIFITIVVIASFSFFGTFSVMSREEQREDRILSQTVDGSSVKLSEVQALSRFIASDCEDIGQHGLIPNLCNDGVVRRDLLKSGLADLLVASYFGPLKEEMASRLERVQRYRPYVHPEVSFLSAEAVWAQFLPALNRELKGLKEEMEAAPAVFSRLVRLYEQQSYLPPDALRRILVFHHRQLGLGNMDPRMQYDDLSLFGFHSLSDWFSRDFLDLSAQFILNGAALAERKGFRVTTEEAKGDLICNFYTSIQKKTEMQNHSELNFHQHLQQLGFDEKGAAEIWRKVLLFRRYFQGISQASFVDRLPFRDFAAFARETAHVCLYQWPESLHLKNFQELCEFQTYLHAVAPPLSDPLALPSDYFSQEAVSQEYPELIQTSFHAKVKKLPLAEVALCASVKDVWQWQCEENNWAVLKSHFSFLKDGASREERFQCLEKLSVGSRAQVDAFARLRLLDLHPEWIEEKLASVASREQIISLSQIAASLPHIDQPSRFKDLLIRAAQGEEKAKRSLLRYSDDAKTVYQLEEIRFETMEHILTFDEAKRFGVLSSMTDRYLQSEYVKIRNKSPSHFKTKEGGWKSFLDVKNEIAKIVFSDVCKAIETLDAKEWTDGLYASYRMLPTSRIALHDLQKDPLDPRWIHTKNCSLEEQFKLIRKERPIHRTEQEDWMKENSFTMLPNEWSPIHVSPTGDIAFFYLVEKRVNETPILEQISFGQQLIAADAQRYLAEGLLKEIVNKQAIVMPVSGAR